MSIVDDLRKNQTAEIVDAVIADRPPEFMGLLAELHAAQMRGLATNLEVECLKRLEEARERRVG